MVTLSRARLRTSLRWCVCQRYILHSVKPGFLDRAVFFLVDNVDILISALANRHEESGFHDQHTLSR